jgi:ribosomal protein S18 acetylase RimI-like enzyme
LGRALLVQSLRGFVTHGLHRGALEVTALNHVAVQMYRRFGFRCRKTLYRGVAATIPLAEPEWAL